MTLTTPNHPIFDILCRLSYLRSEWSSNLVGRLLVAIASPWIVSIPERGLAKSREPFKFLEGTTISLERLIVSGAVRCAPVWQQVVVFSYALVC